MKAILIGPNLEENLSISYLCSAIERSGHECLLIPFNHDREIPKVAGKLLRCGPALIGLSLVAQRRYSDFQKLVAEIRRRGFSGHITAGGHFAALRAQEVLRDTPEIDSIIHHDGELRIVNLLNKLEFHTLSSGSIDELMGGSVERAPDGPVDESTTGPLDGVSWRGSDGTIRHLPATKVASLDSLPFPARRRPDKALGYARAPIVSSRGCSGSCSFCSIHAWHKQVPSDRLRFRSPRNVAEEMVLLHREHGVRVFVFHDDDFIHPDRRKAKKRCEEILEQAERGIGQPLAFVIKCRPDDVEEELFRYLRNKGLVRAYVGIEAHAASGLAALNRRVSPQVNLEALDILRRVGVYACFNLLIFHPGTTIPELQENLMFLRRQLRCPFDIARTELYARSTLEDRMIQEGRAIGDYRGFDYRILDDKVETAFQLFNSVLWDRHFGGSSILQRVQDLGFRHSLLSRFHPEMTSPDLKGRIRSLIESVNSATVENMQRITDLAIAGRRIDQEAMGALRQAVNARTRLDTVRWASLSLELEGRALLARSKLSRLPSVNRVPRLLGRIAAAVPALGLFLVPLACSQSSNSTVCDPPPPPARSFANDIEPKLDQSCALAGCHSAESAAADLNLSAGSSYGNIVGVPSTQVPGLNRVEPGRSDSSYIVNKLLGTQASAGGSGERMPKGGPPDNELLSEMGDWIDDGAEEN